MTREIALHCMKSYSELHSDLCELCPIYGETGSDHCFEDALQYVIEMLEQEPKILALLEKTYADFCKCEGGEGWLKIDGKEYATDAGYALEGMGIFMEVFKRRLAELPPVTPQPRWIPVSEKLLDTDDEVLCWYEYYHWSQEKVLPEYGLGRYFKETKAWFGEVANGKDVRVIAWMPLPKAYREDEE